VPQEEEEEDYYENKKIRVAYGRSLKYIEYSVLVVVTTTMLRFECF
jgi:hypothetical protein